jgi:hypothetical protein
MSGMSHLAQSLSSRKLLPTFGSCTFVVGANANCLSFEVEIYLARTGLRIIWLRVVKNRTTGMPTSLRMCAVWPDQADVLH